MCAICDLVDIKDPALRKHALVELLSGAASTHPWEYMVAPMGEAERAFYDLDSPLRRKDA